MVWLTLGATGCGDNNSDSTGNNGRTTDAAWSGFTRLEDLGDVCSAATAIEPSKEYSPLTWIPCASGLAGCEELKWDGVLRWDPTGDGDMLEFHARLALDSAGRATRLSVVRRYPRGPAYQGIPFEAVVYDLTSGAPLAAIRNVGSINDGGTIGSESPRCELEPIPTQNGLWLVGNPSGQTSMVAGFTNYENRTAIKLRPVEASRDAFDATISGSDDVLGLEEKDGKLVRVGVDPARDASSYGPAVRVRLEQVVGTDFITSNTQPAGPTQFFRFDQNAKFTSLAIRGTLPRFDGIRVASVEQAANEWVVLTAPFTAASTAEVTMNEVTRITDEDLYVVDASLGDGRLALIADVGFGATPKRTAMLVNLDGTGVAKREIGSAPSAASKVSLLGNDATHVYFTETALLSDSHLVRYSITP